MTGIKEAPQHLCLAPVLASGKRLRQTVGGTLATLGASFEETADMALAVSEAFNNAICHGSMEPGDCLLVEIETAGSEITVALDYRGEPFPVTEPTLPDPAASHGRGRYLMEILTDRVTYEFHDHWTRATLRKRIRGE